MRSGKCTVLGLVLVLFSLLIIAAMLFPMFARTHCGSRKEMCLNNLKQCAQALKMYADDYNGQMPSSYLVTHSKSWNKRDALYFCTRRGKIPFENSPRRTWAEALYDHMRSPDIVFCPSDTIDHESRIAKTSYWYKVANDKAWYGVGCEKPRRNMADYGYEADQVAFYEHCGWHFGDTTGRVTKGIQYNMSYVDTHVETVALGDGTTTGDPINCAVNSNGEPMYYNTNVDKAGIGSKQAGPATLTDPACCYDTL